MAEKVKVCGNEYNIKGVRALDENGNMVTYTPCGYDLIIEADPVLIRNLSASDVHIVVGNILDAEDKLANGVPVNALFIVHNDWSWLPSTANSSVVATYLPLVRFDAPYQHLIFGGVAKLGGTGVDGRIDLYSVEVRYDYTNGDITAVSGSSKFVLTSS